jgi:hypothetical protein
MVEIAFKDVFRTIQLKKSTIFSSIIIYVHLAVQLAQRINISTGGVLLE